MYSFVALSTLFALMLGTGDSLDKTPEWLVSNTDWDIFVATVQHVENMETTNANPPVVRLEVEEVLRGETSPGQLTAEWAVFFGFRCGNTEEFRMWSRLPLRGPTPNSRWLLAGYVGTHDVFILHPSARFKFSQELLEWARHALDRSSSK